MVAVVEVGAVVLLLLLLLCEGGGGVAMGGEVAVPSPSAWPSYSACAVGQERGLGCGAAAGRSKGTASAKGGGEGCHRAPAWQAHRHGGGGTLRLGGLAPRHAHILAADGQPMSPLKRPLRVRALIKMHKGKFFKALHALHAIVPPAQLPKQCGERRLRGIGGIGKAGGVQNAHIPHYFIGDLLKRLRPGRGGGGCMQMGGWSKMEGGGG